MSKKRLGAAEIGDGERDSGRRPGRIERFRALPGFRTAAVAFVLTVVLGVGSTLAYAYWSQSSPVQITGSTARPPLPVVAGDLQCNQPYGVGVVRITHTKVAALPADANLLASVVVGAGSPKLYAIPNDGTFALKELPGLADALSWGDRLSISVTTAYLNGVPGPVTVPVVVDESKVLARATPAPKPATASYLASFFC